MENTNMYGLDDELGFDDDSQEEIGIQAVKPEKPKRKMFYEWEVGGTPYKLKLNTAMICKLEEKFRTNLLNVVSSDGIPTLSQMLTIIQGAMAPWQHNTGFKNVQKLFDRYVSEGGNQLSLYTDVIMGTMAVSGFFTEEQAANIVEELKEAETMM